MKRILIVFFLINTLPAPIFTVTAQDIHKIDSHSVSKQLLIPNSLMASISDSIIYYSQKCMFVPMWYKISIDSSEDTLYLWITAVQYFDSIYYANNRSWIQHGVFSMTSDNSSGVYYHSDCMVEIIGEKIDRLVVKTDSIIFLDFWQKNMREQRGEPAVTKSEIPKKGQEL